MSGSPEEYHSLDIFAIPPEAYELNERDRKKVVNNLIKTNKGPFAANSLAHAAEISLAEQILVNVLLLVLMGGPLAWFSFVAPAVWIFGSWYSVTIYVLTTLILSLHPIPYRGKFCHYIWKSGIQKACFRYFSYRAVWTGDALERVRACQPYLGAGVPHGVLPFANLLSISAINLFTFTGPFLGAPASVTFNTPFLRYFTMLGTCDCSREVVAKEIECGNSVGVVPDGIAGIFRCNDGDEVCFLKSRKGLAKLSLKTGAPIVPAYSLGNTAVFKAWFDKWGIMERISRKAQLSIFLFWGKFGLPIPLRTPITTIFGPPIEVTKTDNPTQEQIDDVHRRLLQGVEDCFNQHKAALGWGHKTMRIV